MQLSTTPQRFRRCILTILMALSLGSQLINHPVAQAQETPAKSPTIVLDDFEKGVGKWVRNDKIKTQNPAANVLLVDVIATKPAPGGIPGSNGAGLFAFKTAKSSWASASLKVNGTQWAAIGAQKLTFWLLADGATQGVQLVLRGISRAADGSTVDESFTLPQPVRLSTKTWRKVVIPLRDFRSKIGPLTSRLHTLYLLQFVQTGDWESRFFTVDQLQVEGNGVPIRTATPRPPVEMTENTAASANAGETQVNVDFLKTQGRIRSAANVSLGAAWPTSSGAVEVPLDSAPFRAALQTLRPRFVRLDAGSLCDLTDSSQPSFDYRRLQDAVAQVRALKFEPLIAITSPTEWSLDERGYALFAGGVARAINPRGTARPARYFELAVGTTQYNDVVAVASYNQARAALKAISSTYRIGGIGASSGRTGTLLALLRGAAGLDFLSLQFFGTYTANAPASTLMDSARELSTLRSAAKSLDSSKFRNAPIYLTQANLNGARVPGELTPADPRLTQMYAAAWWGRFLGEGSRLADQIFHNDAANPEWGLLNAQHSAYPTYYVMWMWNTFMPPGSYRVETKISGDGAKAVAATAVNTATAHNLMLSNLTDQETTVKVAIRGFPVLRAARMRILDPDNRERGVRFTDLPKSPFQTIKIPPYYVALLQFIEPPRNKR